MENAMDADLPANLEAEEDGIYQGPWPPKGAQPPGRGFVSSAAALVRVATPPQQGTLHPQRTGRPSMRHSHLKSTPPLPPPPPPPPLPPPPNHPPHNKNNKKKTHTKQQKKKPTEKEAGGE